MAEIRSFTVPRRLYRYRSLINIERELKAIENTYLHCSAYRDMNDPMEGIFSSSVRLRKSEKYDAIKEAVFYNKVQIGICSFSEVHDHELMWAHYADQFRGVCVAYDLRRLLRNLPADADFVRMSYNEDKPMVGLTKRPANELAKMVLSHKNYRWLYEREWRLFAQVGKTDYMRADCVTEVYLGSRISPAHQREMERRLGSLSISTVMMEIDGYSMSFKKKGKPRKTP